MKRTLIASITAFAVIGMLLYVADAFAGRGYGRGGGPFGGPGDCPRWGANLTEEQIGKLEAERNAFREATADLRREIRQKELDLRKELAKETPDPALAAEIQKEISALRTELDQKGLAHRLEMRKIDPAAGTGAWFGRRGGRGFRGPGPGPSSL